MQVESTEGLTPALFARFAKVAYDNAGILLKPGKESLVLARVTRRLRALELSTPEEYAARLEKDTSGVELVHFLDAISTNVTSFFRESDHFDFLRDWIRAEVKGGARRLRFWSAACSSGEEPYTLAMVLADVLGMNFDWRILATDVSTVVLDRAARGLYASSAVQPVPAPYRKAYLEEQDGSDPGDVVWRVKEELRARVLLRRVNLARPPYPMRGPLDVVLCRNVMIYFDNSVRLGIVRDAERMLRPGGLFITSHTETLTGLPIELRVRPSIYLKGRER